VAAGAETEQRHGPHPPPANALSLAERAALLATVTACRTPTSPPNQIVPRLADAGQYLASESTIYWALREAEQLAHRGRAAAPQRRTPPSHEATGRKQVWSWDVTYFRTPVRAPLGTCT
jgi:putative transposase